MIDLSTAQVRSFFTLAADRMMANKDALCELDAQAGDGDIGLTMSKGFSAVRAKLAEDPPATVPEAFRAAAMTMMNTVPSTMGTLLASGLLRVSSSASGADSTETVPLTTVLDGLVEGIQARGQAQPGDKTILDSLVAARAAAGARDSSAIVAAAEKAARETAAMRAVHGRAARYSNGSSGKVDPGAVVGAHLVGALVEAAGTSP
jgi:dihydroxyacetone kinase-like protein